MPAQRDMATLRREIIKEVVQHPLTLYPMGVAAVCIAWGASFSPSPATVVGAIGGAALGVVGAFYNLLIRGEYMRDRILARWDRQEAEAREAAKVSTRQELITARRSDDLVRLFDDFEALREVLMDALVRSELSELRRAEIEILVEENHQESLRMFGRLAFLQRKLTRLLDDAPGRNGVSSDAVRVLREERQALSSQVRLLMDALDQISKELPRLGEEAVEDSQRELEKLRDSIRVARAAQQAIDAQISRNPDRTPQ